MLGQSDNQCLDPGPLDVFEGLPVRTRRPVIGAAHCPGLAQHVLPVDLVVQRIEPKFRRLLRTQVKRLLQVPNLFRCPASRGRPLAALARKALASFTAITDPFPLPAAYRLARPLRSSGITRLHHYNGPLRLLLRPPGLGSSPCTRRCGGDPLRGRSPTSRIQPLSIDDVPSLIPRKSVDAHAPSLAPTCRLRR